MRNRASLLALSCLLCWTLAACAGGTTRPPAGGGGSGGSGGTAGSGASGGSGGTGGASIEPLALTWSACNLFTDGPQYDAECATVEVPLRWEDPSAGTIELFVKRLPAIHERRGTLWILDGGPGGGGIGPESFAYMISAAGESGLDILVPHHRGTGQSTKLECAAADPASEGGIAITVAEWPACIEELQAKWRGDLAAFSTTEAARDLAALIDAVKEPGDQTFVMGGSYGTYLANRYLLLAPNQATGVILDSICPPDRCNLDQFDVLFDQVASTFLAQCGADAECSAHLGADPRNRLEALYRSLDEGHCPAIAAAGLDRRKLRTVLGQLLTDWNNRLAIAPVIYRLERCDPADVDAVTHLLRAAFGSPDDPVGPFLEAWSFPLQDNITFSELWTDPAPAPDALAAAADATLISEGVTMDDAQVFPLWPRYPRDEYDGIWAQVDVPMLMMNGDLDPATPIDIAQRAREHFRGEHQTFVTMPRSPHSVLTGSPISADGATCGMKLVLDFLADPLRPLDTSCKDAVFPVRFAGAPWLAERLFGVADMWENP